MLIERADQLLNSTDLSRNTKGGLDGLARGRKGKLVVMWDNKPAAVLMSIKEYEAQLDELADLRIEAIGAERLARFDPPAAILRADSMAEFGAD